MLGILAYVLILAISARYGLAGIGILAIYGVIVLLTPFFTNWVFQGLRQMQWVAVGSALRYGTFAALVLLLVHPGVDTRIVGVAEVSGALVLVAVNAILLFRVLRIRLDWRGAWGGAIDLFKDAWFLGASDLAWATTWYSPNIMTGWMAIARTEHVAWVAASVRIVMALHTFVWLYFFNMIPNLSRELQHSVESWRELVHRSMNVSMWPPCFVALCGTLLGPVIVNTVYGGEYGAAVLPFQLAIWMIPVAWWGGHFRFSLIASGHQHLEFGASLVGALTTVVLAFAGIWHFGAPGATAALVAGGLANAVVAYVAMRRVIGPIQLRQGAAPVLSCVVALSVGFAIGPLVGRMSGAVVGCLFYAALAARQWDLARVREAWEGRLDLRPAGSIPDAGAASGPDQPRHARDSQLDQLAR
jgi:O-antigen/teichoic acid export membrane protein